MPGDPAERQADLLKRCFACCAGYALIAAVCRSQGAALATRNVSDFDGTGIRS